MLNHTKIAFYAPIKPPDHPIASGDRLIAQNLIKALEIAGADVVLASRYIAYSKRPDAKILETKKAGALCEADKLVKTFKALPHAERPKLWVTYHPYCKAPDWIGPIVSKVLDIPYVTIEAARTGQGGSEDLWKDWRAQAQAGICEADLHLVFKPTDEAYLKALIGSANKLRALNPFIDAENMPLALPANLPSHWDLNVPTLITTGMMRKGKKVENFKILSEIISGIDTPYNLVIIGGGPEEQTVRGHFSSLDKQQVHWTGAIDHEEVLQWMRASDVFVWPGWKEPIGMVYLEAQLQGLPVIAYKSMGVPLVVKDKSTGFLALENDIQSMQDNIIHLLSETDIRQKTGRKARQYVLAHHGIQSAANRLSQLLDELI